MGFVNVQVEGLDRAQYSLEQLRRLRGARRGIAAAALHLKGKFATYPAKNRPSRESVYGKTFVSDKQRRFVMAAIRRGDIPYTRGVSSSSETLGRRWTTEERRGGLEQVVGNNASYAEYVQGDKQSKYMKAVGWERVDAIADREARTLQRIVDYEVRRLDV